MLNASLRTQIDSLWWDGFVSYFVGTVAMLVVAPAGLGAGGHGWVAWTGGLFGAIFIAVRILMAPRLGAATVLALPPWGSCNCCSLSLGSAGPPCCPTKR